MARSLSRHLTVCLVTLVLAACGAPGFDEVADRRLSAAQAEFDEGAAALIGAARTVEFQRTRLPPPPAPAVEAARRRVSYEANRAWYDAVDAALNGARLRVTADAATPPSIDTAFQQIQANLDDLRGVHEAQDGISSTAAIAARRIINAQFGTLTRYQLVLRTGRRMN